MVARRRVKGPTETAPVVREGRINVTRGIKQGGILVSETDKQETISVRKFEVEPAYVTVKAGLTKELGSYEFLRLDVSISVPCYVEEMNEAFDLVGDLVARRLDSEVNGYMEGLTDDADKN